jgi:hypothetical protein
VNEYLNKFTQMSRYAPDEVNTDEKKQDAFLNGLNCHTPVLGNRTEASIRVPRMFKSHVEPTIW